MKYFDKTNNRLLLIEQSPTEEFWNDHWFEDKDFLQTIRAGAGRGIVKKFTQKYLKTPARVVDAGCGIGQNVYGLKQWGYDAYGIDFTDKVVARTKEHFPELTMLAQDVRKLDIPDNYFDGYWSVGVIEHFTEGYNEIIKEAHRVIKNDGYLFLTFPWFSPLRKLKARMGEYGVFSDSVDMKDFYEFMLNERDVIKNVEAQGFTCVLRHAHDAAKGIKDEIKPLSGILRKIYRGRNSFYKGMRFLTSFFFAPFAGHIILLVFRKNQ